MTRVLRAFRRRVLVARRVEPDLLNLSNERAGDVLQTPLLPGLDIPLARVFRVPDISSGGVAGRE